MVGKSNNNKNKVNVYNKLEKPEIGKKSISLRISDILIPLVIFTVIVLAGIFIIKNNFQNKIYVAQLKSAYSVMEQGLKNAVANQGEENITTTEIWRACNFKKYKSDYDKCEQALKKYFAGARIVYNSDEINGLIADKEACKQSVGKYNKWWNLNSDSYCSGWNNLTFTLSNGTKFDLLAVGENDSYIVGQLTVDVNGEREPNRWGRDAFMFNITRDGSLIPYGGRRDCIRLAEYLHMNLDEVLNQRHWQYTDICSSTTSSDGTSCASRIIENSWKMDY